MGEKKEGYEKALGGVGYLIRDLQDRNKDMARINIREREILFNMEGKRLDLLEVQYNLNTSELETRKFRLEGY